MYKKSLLALLFCLFLGYASHAQARDECNRYSIPSLGIAFCTPLDWTIEKNAVGNDLIKGKNSDGVPPNMNVSSQAYPGTIAKFADASVAAVLKTKPEGLNSIALVSRNDFQAGRIQGVKVVFKLAFKEVQMRSIQYYFSGKGDTKILITATMLLTDAEEFEGLIDDAVETFTLK